MIKHYYFESTNSVPIIFYNVDLAVLTCLYLNRYWVMGKPPVRGLAHRTTYRYESGPSGDDTMSMTRGSSTNMTTKYKINRMQHWRFLLLKPCGFGTVYYPPLFLLQRYTEWRIQRVHSHQAKAKIFFDVRGLIFSLSLPLDVNGSLRSIFIYATTLQEFTSCCISAMQGLHNLHFALIHNQFTINTNVTNLVHIEHSQHLSITYVCLVWCASTRSSYRLRLRSWHGSGRCSWCSASGSQYESLHL